MKPGIRSVLAILMLGVVVLPSGLAGEKTGEGWKVLDHVVWPREQLVGGLTVGGLSGLAFDPRANRLYAVSDARKWPSSVIFQFDLALETDGRLRLSPVGLIRLAEPKKLAEPLDAEGMALWTHRRAFISHEGSKSGRLAPGVACFSLRTGRPLFSLKLPDYFFAKTAEEAWGLQENRGFEGLTIGPAPVRHLWAVNESPLIQDLNRASEAQRGPVRLLQFDLKKTDALPSQRAYVAESDALFTSVVELLALGESRLLVLERQILLAVPPRSRRFRIFEVDFKQADATDIAALPQLRGQKITPLRKRLVFDSLKAGLRGVDNVEGLTRGPDFQGRPTLLLVSDDNFSPSQQTEFWLLQPDFAASSAP
jgi:hypothetical protein